MPAAVGHSGRAGHPLAGQGPSAGYMHSCMLPRVQCLLLSPGACLAGVLCSTASLSSMSWRR